MPVMESYPSTHFVGTVADNTQENKNAWANRVKKFPTIYFIGYCSVGFTIPVTDTFVAKKTRKYYRDMAKHPLGYPLWYMLEFARSCKDVVNYNNHIAKAHLQEAQKTAGVRYLTRAAPERWGTIQAIWKALLATERLLHRIFSVLYFTVGTASIRTGENQGVYHRRLVRGKAWEYTDNTRSYRHSHHQVSVLQVFSDRGAS